MCNDTAYAAGNVITWRGGVTSAASLYRNISAWRNAVARGNNGKCRLACNIDIRKIRAHRASVLMATQQRGVAARGWRRGYSNAGRRNQWAT